MTGNKKHLTITSVVGVLLLAFATLLHSRPEPKEAPTASKQLKMLVFADLHYLSPTLFDTASYSFQKQQRESRRLSKVSSPLWNTTVSDIMHYPENIVLICGDMVHRGERQSHAELVEGLHKLKQSGKRIFVIPGNNDLQNPLAMIHQADTLYPVKALSKNEFLRFYAPFGYDEAIARDTSSLSYIASLDDKNWLFAIDATRYSPTGNIIEHGAIDRNTIHWLNDRFAEAKQKGVSPYVMIHYNLIEHFENQSEIFPTALLHNHNALANYFADKGVKVIFSGHFHANDISFFESLNGNKLYEIATSSYIAPPFAFRRISIDNHRMQVYTESITQREDLLKNKGKEWDSEFTTLLTESYQNLLTSPPFAFNETLAALIAPIYAKAMITHYKGDELQNTNVEASIRMLKMLNLPYDMSFIYSLYKDLPPADNQVTLNLSEK